MTATRVAGALVALGGFALFVLYVAVPVGSVGTADVPALVDLGSTYVDVGMVAHCMLVTTVGLALALRPAPGVVLAAALPLPWVLGAVGAAADLEQGTQPVLKGVEGAGALVVAGVVLALASGLRARRPAGGLLATGGAAVAVVVGALGLAAGAGWYEVAGLADSPRFGGMLDTATWSGRGAWLGLVLAAAALVVAAAGGGAGRRAVGVVAAGVLVAEALRRTLLSSAAVLGAAAETPFGPLEVRRVPLLLAVPLVGAAGAAWLATTDGDPAEPDPDPLVEDVEPPAPAVTDAVLPGQPPTSWPD